MDNPPQLSVIVPVYNTGIFLRPCLESILCQTFKNLEIILVDDGSDDTLTLDLLNVYRKKDSRIRLVTKKNEGQSKARNAGLSESKGRYVAFVDHDDVLNSNMYEILLKVTEKEEIDIVECRYEALPLNRLETIDLNYRPLSKTRSISIKHDKDYLVKHIQIWKKIYRNNFLMENNLIFDDLLWEEDVLFSFKTSILADSLVFVDATLYYHLKHEENTTRKLGSKIFDTFRAQDLLKAFLMEKNCFETYKQQYFARVIKDFLHSLAVVNESFEKTFFIEAHNRIKDISLDKYKEYFSRSKKKLLRFAQKGDFNSFKRYQTFRDKRKRLIKKLFFSLSLKKRGSIRNSET